MHGDFLVAVIKAWIAIVLIIVGLSAVTIGGIGYGVYLVATGTQVGGGILIVGLVLLLILLIKLLGDICY